MQKNKFFFIVFLFLLIFSSSIFGIEISEFKGLKELKEFGEFINMSAPVTSFTFIGNKSFKSNKLRSLTQLGNRSIFNIPQFNEDELKKDINRIKSFYTLNGFLLVTVEEMIKFGPRKAWVEIIFNIKEGTRTKISNINFTGIYNFKTFEIESQVSTKINEYLNPFQLQEDRKKILMFYNNHGYVYARVKHFIKFNEDKTQADITFLIEERQMVYVDKIKIEGLVITKDNVVKREVEIEEGDVLLWQKLVDTQKNINNLGIFTDIRFEPENLDDTKDRVNLTLRLKEYPPRYFGFSLGYGSIDRERVRFEWGHDNLFGLNQRIKLSTTFTSLEDLYTISFIKPRILDTQNNLISTSSYHRTINNNFKVIEGAVSSDLRRKLTKYFIGSAEYKLQNTDYFDVDTTYLSQVEEKKSYTQSFIYRLIFDSKDSFFYPTKGMSHTFSYQYAGGILKSDNSFKRYEYNGNLFFNIFEKIVFGFNVQTGLVREFGKSEFVPLIEKSYGKSISSLIRGYGADEIGPKDGGNVVFASNFEMRFPIYNKMFGVLFYDAGEIFQKEWKDIKVSEFRRGHGIGLRYHTLVGPFRLDYGEKIDRKPGESPGQYYITIGQSF